MSRAALDHSSPAVSVSTHGMGRAVAYGDCRAFKTHPRHWKQGRGQGSRERTIPASAELFFMHLETEGVTLGSAS